MKQIIFIADFFYKDIPGGGEANNEEVIQLLQKKHKVKKIYTNCTEQLINENKDSFFIIGNFTRLSQKVKKSLYNKNYIIYQHDHQYLVNRNPAIYPNYIVPENKIINKTFFKNAKAVLCQSEFHKNITQKNLKLDNIISLSGNAWSDENFELIKKLNKKYPIEKKRELCSIMKSQTEHKNTLGSVEYCKKNNLSFDLIGIMKYEYFLQRLAKNKKFCFFPKTPETLSRVVLEAKMLNVEILINENVGAQYENWFHLNGNELIYLLKNKKYEIVNTVLALFLN